MASSWKLTLLLAFVHGMTVEAFVNPSLQAVSSDMCQKDDASPSALKMGNVFDDIQNFFSEFGDNKKGNDASEDEETTENRIVTIPGKFLFVLGCPFSLF